MSAKKIFVDTNILIYAYDRDAGEKHERCKTVLTTLWQEGNGVISTQVMQEFYVNITRKIPQPLSHSQTREILSQYETWQVETITPPLIQFASTLHEKHPLSFWDSLIMAAAHQAKVESVLTEDLNTGQIIEGITIKNPLAYSH